MRRPALLPLIAILAGCGGPPDRLSPGPSSSRTAPDSGQHLVARAVHDTIPAEAPIEVVIRLLNGAKARPVYYFDSFLDVIVLDSSGVSVRPVSSQFWDTVRPAIIIPAGASHEKTIDIAAVVRPLTAGRYRIVIAYRYPRPAGSSDISRAYPVISADTLSLAVVAAR